VDRLTTSPFAPIAISLLSPREHSATASPAGDHTRFESLRPQAMERGPHELRFDPAGPPCSRTPALRGGEQRERGEQGPQGAEGHRVRVAAFLFLI
jgi:hypothetical protein